MRIDHICTVTERIDRLRLDASFSSTLQAFLTELANTDWASRCPGCLFIRDFEGLPDTAPFDIDLLCARPGWPALIEIVRDAASAQGLILSNLDAGAALYLLVIDIDGPTDRRRHAFLEVRHTLGLDSSQFAIQPPNSIKLLVPDIPRATDPGLPVPQRDWHCALLYLQALRKPDAHKYLRRIGEFEPTERARAREILTSQFGFPANELTAWIAAPTAIVSRNSSVVKPQRASRRESLRAFCANHLFFLPLLKLDFCTIHGPDGVGKSTTCDEVERLFDGLPFGIYKFHHSEGWKEGRGRTGKSADGPLSATKQSIPAGRPSVLRRMARTIYRALPGPLQEFWLWNSHFINYNRKFTRFVLDNRNNGDILFADRYVYDVRIKYIVETDRPSWLVRGYYRLHCAIMPKPRFGFVLIDDPAAIAKRKAELTEIQISRFIEWIVRILRKSGMAYTTSAVAGRTPNEIAREIARKLIEIQGPELILQMRTFVSRIEATDAALHNAGNDDQLQTET